MRWRRWRRPLRRAPGGTAVADHRRLVVLDGPHDGQFVIQVDGRFGIRVLGAGDGTLPAMRGLVVDEPSRVGVLGSHEATARIEVEQRLVVGLVQAVGDPDRPVAVGLVLPAEGAPQDGSVRDPLAAQLGVDELLEWLGGGAGIATGLGTRASSLM